MMFEPIVWDTGAACWVLVHPEIQILDKALAEIGRLQIPVISIGKELSAVLLDVQRSEQPRAILRWFDARFSTPQDQVLACSRIDLLFDPGFQLDPLALFRKAARVNRLIVLWPGDILNHTLSYALPEHHHFRTWQVDDPALRVHRLMSFQ